MVQSEHRMSRGQGGMTRPDQLIHVRTSADLTYKRAQLLTNLFGGSLPSEVGTLSSVTSPITLSGVATCQKITMTAYPSRPRVWTPTSHNGDLIIMHQGHSGTYGSYSMTPAIQAAIDEGFMVCGMVMPGSDGTETQSGTSTSHNAAADTLDKFVGPVPIAINTLEGSVNNIHMTGLSGGGWTTVLAAAADTRIQNSYPTSGTLPLHLPSARDHEQGLPGLAVSYLDLYIMGASPAGRRQKQINHIADDCCFKQADYNQSLPYAERVAEIAASLGGDYDLVWRTKATHEFDTTIFAEEVLAEI